MTDRDKKIARAKAALLWGLIVDTPETGALAEPLQKGVRFRELANSDKITVLGLVKRFEEGCREIEGQANRPETPAQGGEAVTSESAQVATGEIVNHRGIDEETPAPAIGDDAEETDPPPPDPAPAPRTEAA